MFNTSKTRSVNIWLAAIMVAVLVACNGPVSRPVIEILDPDVTAQPGQVPNQPPPTPDQTPAQLLATADRLVHNGNYEAALQTYNTLVVTPGIDSQIAASAQFGMGRAALEQGAFSPAVVAFDAFLSAYPTHPEVPTAHYLRGEAKLGISDWSGAIGDFLTYVSLRPGLADSYAYEGIGDAYVALGQSTEAVGAYEQAINTGRHISSLVALRERLAQIHLGLNNPQGAIDQYAAILNVAQISVYRAKIQFLLAQAYTANNQPDAAIATYAELVNTYPFTADAYNALDALDAAGQPVDFYQRGLIAYNAEDYVAAEQAFYNWLAAADLQHPADAHFFRARSYANLGNPGAAVTEYQTIIDTHEDDPQWGLAFVEMVSARAQTGDIEGALAVAVGFANDNPDSPYAADAYYAAAELTSNAGDYTRAGDYYLRVGLANPGDERATEGLLQTGIAYHLAGNPASAEQLLRSAISNAQGTQLAASHYWLGRVLQSQGRTGEATEAYTAATNVAPGTYYALRATDLLTNRQPFQPPPGINFTFDDVAAQTEAENWLVTTFALEAAPPLSSLRSDLAAEGRVVRGRELARLGLYDEARLELDGVIDDYRGDALAQYQLAILCRDLSLYRLSIKATGILIDLSGQPVLDVPRFIGRLYYPLYYSDLILPAAQQYTLDPLLVFSLVRQESRFEGFVTSSAYAQGLMQIIPTTGQDIATRLSWPGYQNDDLYRPYVNVAFGTYYLDQQRTYLDGDVLAALAAYNAGPGRASQWRTESGGDMDLFVENIPFSETYSYATTIYAQYDIYRQLYGTGG